MAAAHDTRHSFLGSHGGPGARKAHDHLNESRFAPARSTSLPQLGIPAGHSRSVGNRLSLQHYQKLRGPFVANTDWPHHPNGGRYNQAPRVNRQAAVEEWIMPERVCPASLPPAGGIKEIRGGKRRVDDNTNTRSHVDTLIWGIDVDGSDGTLNQANSATYAGSAGINEKAERTPIYGHLPPTCARTFGPEGAPQAFDGAGTTSYKRLDPKFDYVDGY